MSIKQGGNLIAGSGGGVSNIDNLSITENANEEIQTVGVINSRDSSTAVKTWTGTKAQYDAIVTKDPNTLYNITDDTELQDLKEKYADTLKKRREARAEINQLEK